MTKLLRTLSRLAFRRGVLGGSREWVAMWVVTTLWSRARKKSEEPPPVVHREVLESGDSIRISVYDPPVR
ncbi:MAG: hypothetical protein M3357_09300 [Actinomycetota bacterium]|nr:hypothetical protein [Actinomycetota bacterium]